MNDLEVTAEIFDKIKYLSKNNVEFWSARELYPVLEHKDWRNFEKVLNKAQEACRNSNHTIQDHFVEVTKMVKLGFVTEREAI